MPKKQRSLETILLADYLEHCFIENKLATYHDMEQIVNGCSDRSRRRYFLDSALEYVKIQYGYMYSCIQMVGYEPIPNKNRLLKVEKNRLGRIKTQVKKWDFELDTIDASKLQEPEQEKLFASQMKVSAHKLILDDKLEQTFALASKRHCASASKVDLSFESVKQAFKALTF